MSDTANSFKEFIDIFNRINKTYYTTKVIRVQKSYNARVKEGWTNQQIGIAIYGASKNLFLIGQHPNNQTRYLTPEYILRQIKLEQYYNEGLRIIKLEQLKKREEEEQLRKEKELEEYRLSNPSSIERLREMKEKFLSKLSMKTQEVKI